VLIELKADYFDNMLRGKKAYARMIDPVCKKYKLTRNELDILLFLHNNPDFNRASDIVSRRGIAKSHVSMSVNSLEKRGLILRETDPEDRRTIHLILAPEAHDMAREGRSAQERYFHKLYEGLSPEEIILWKTVIYKVNKNLADMEV